MACAPFSPESVTLAILAGGEGSRMGRAKGLLRIGGKPILEYLLDRIDWPGPVWLITAPGREHPPGWERFGHEWCDPAAGLGPLRGVLTALEHLQGPMLAVTPVDMPGVGREHLAWLASWLWQRADGLGAMFRSNTGAGTIPQPFPLVLRAQAIDVVRRRLESGRRSVRGLGEEPGISVVAAPAQWDSRVWANLNSPADLGPFDAGGPEIVV